MTTSDQKVYNQSHRQASYTHEFRQATSVKPDRLHKTWSPIKRTDVPLSEFLRLRAAGLLR